MKWLVCAVIAVYEGAQTVLRTEGDCKKTKSKSSDLVHRVPVTSITGHAILGQKVKFVLVYNAQAPPHFQ